MGAKSLCIPFAKNEGEIFTRADSVLGSHSFLKREKVTGCCIRPACGLAAKYWTMFGRSY